MPRERADTLKEIKMKLSLVLMGSVTLWLMACTDLPASDVVPEPALTVDRPHTVACEGGIPFSLEGFETQDPMVYIEAPDSDATRATAPLEIAVLAQLARSEILPPVMKRYCQMGATQMVVEMTHPVEDDAVMALTLRAIYRWVADEAGVGWQIAEVGTRQQCARGRNAETNLCS